MAITGIGSIPETGPVLMVANHPNSFLDAIIIGSICPRPVHFLARGDAFRKPWHNRLLSLLKMIPVYRLSEGKENLHLNEAAFKRSREILSQNGIVLIFIEGICVNKHELQPFKKGAARIALENCTHNKLQVLPLALAYDSFKKFGKKINIHIGKALFANSLFPFEEQAKNIRHFNTVLFNEINTRIEIPTTQQSKTKQPLLLLPGLMGYYLHLPIYSILSDTIQAKTKGTVFFDSVLFGTLLIVYPAYLLLLCFILYMFSVPLFILAIVFCLHPILAWCAVRFYRRN